MKYDIAWPRLKVVSRYNVDILLKLSIGIRRYCFTESSGGILIYIACTEPIKRYEPPKSLA
jgi:hypothetical protein